MYQTLRTAQKQYFYSGITRSLEFRLNQLDKLRKVIKQNENRILHALKLDLNKSKEEAFTTEIGFLYAEITHFEASLKEWMSPQKVKSPASHTGAKSYVIHEPRGSVLIIAPWNYPFQLAMAPLVGAMAAGNCAVVKPSELTPHTSAVIAELLGDTFSDDYIAVVEGAVETSTELLNEPFDYIFFTGSVGVGKVVMEAAAKHLTPHTLELGGKSPAIVHHDAKLDLAAKRIAWGKFLNAGQTCIAPDYVLVDEQVKDEFLKKLEKHTNDLYKKPWKKGQYPRIVSDRHFDRLVKFLEDGRVLVGGQYKRDDLALSPTVLDDVEWDSPIMQDEIFGPILPILTYSSTSEAQSLIRDRPNPLALYVFTESKEVEAQFVEELSFGGGCVNDTIMHVANPYLPFGGAGTSGIGAYHGYDSFLTFSHKKGMVKQSTAFDLPVRYKQGPITHKLVRKLMK
ncbi:aldehyde dehydrogenase [Alkalicoccobacillus murimartini]|uniref:Aldehyde dehydrogenase n=1 Tax=Alkalicoccobacillus murimartini TaxID=171685 RepID=A0ABT9YL48_9BACI|nr:aldehyde dehydrogenase [Alkalicoccobacillus murimartini]MDQ0208318.1 aldehyde dehydrogenase (NAD+) [Alkalicoccobacillus murimartini]